LFEAKRRYGLCVLNSVVTSNHSHLLVQDQGKGEIAKSLRLLAGRTGREYNQRIDRVPSGRTVTTRASTMVDDESCVRQRARMPSVLGRKRRAKRRTCRHEEGMTGRLKSCLG
jgi:REP element-mobilizing transposase RayT